MKEEFKEVCYRLIEENAKQLKETREDDEKYNEIYQNEVIKPLMKLFYNEPYFHMPKVGFTRKTFEGIEYKKINQYQSTNLIIGTINQHYNFKMANILAINSKYRHFRSSDVIRYDDWIVFNGVMLEIELPKMFNFYFYIKSKRSILSKDLNEMLREFKLRKYKVKKKEIEEYNIYTSNKDIVEIMTTKDIMSKLLEYSNIETGEFCEIAIKENHLYVMFPNVRIPGTNVILYENKENMYQELWNEYKKFNSIFELSQMLIKRIIASG